MQNSKIEYDDISQAISNLGLNFLPEELHGQMCGVLISSPISKVEDWLFELIGSRDENNIIAKSGVTKISGLLSATLSDLNNNEFKFELLMPDDEALMPIKLQSLANWCDSFLYGFALSEVKIDEGSESMGFIKDLSEIAMVDTQDDANVQNDLALEELLEYVRVGVLLLQENHRPVVKNPDDEILQ
jgi:uncharacterized protein YgfB (UPF0149 family)